MIGPKSTKNTDDPWRKAYQEQMRHTNDIILFSYVQAPPKSNYCATAQKSSNFTLSKIFWAVKNLCLFTKV